MDYTSLGAFLPILLSGKYSVESTKKLKEAVNLIYHDSEEAIRILDTIGARPNPQYGNEIVSAAVYFYKGVASYDLGRERDAIYYLSLVEKIPSWYVVMGKSTLMDIKEEAKKLKYKIEH